VPRRKIPAESGEQAITSYQAGNASAEQIALAVRYFLQELAIKHPGSAVEVRVPPYGATQCLAGPSHSRGTPANVVEVAAEPFLELALGKVSFQQLSAEGLLSASGNRSNLTDLFPIFSA
jgi:hypothetical protein